jgi:hypothetical protein
LKHHAADMMAAGRALLAALTLGVALACLTPATAEEEMSWFGYADETMAAVAYGIPDSDYAPLVIRCDKGATEAVFRVEHEAIKAKNGAKLPVRLTTGALKLEISTTAHHQEMDDSLHLQGRVKLAGPLRDILGSTGKLTLTAEGRDTEYPLKGAAKAATKLFAMCGGKAP